MSADQVSRPNISFVRESSDFAINFLGSRFTVIAGTRDFAAKENVILVFAVLDHPKSFAHPPLANHFASIPSNAANISRSPAGNISQEKFLSHAPAHTDAKVVEQLFAFGIKFILYRQHHGHSERWTSPNNRHLVQRIGVLEQNIKNGMTGLVVGRNFLFFFTDRQATPFPSPTNFVARFFQFREGDSF